MGGKVGLRCKVKTLIGHYLQTFLYQKIVDNKLPAMFSQKFKKKIKCSGLLEGDGIEFRLPFEIVSILPFIRVSSGHPSLLLTYSKEVLTFNETD